MIITRTPLRVSFLGGGTDFPGWFLKNGGMVVGGAVNKFSYVSTRYLPPYHEYRTRVVYSCIETVNDNTKIEQRAVRACLEVLGLGQDGPGLEIMHSGDLPGRTGTGSSSTFVVGLLNALSSLAGRHLLPHQLAELAVGVERDVLAETGGWQDQTWAAHGGLNYIRFERGGNVNVYPLALPHEAVAELEAHLALFYTGVVRSSGEVASGYARALASDGKHQWAMLRLAEEGVQALLGRDWQALGRLLDRAWALKRTLGGVTSLDIDRFYAAGRLAGAVGGKLLGAGGGGCLLFVLPEPAARARLDQTMRGLGLVPVPFRFEQDGSRVVFVDRDNIKEYRRETR